MTVTQDVPRETASLIPGATPPPEPRPWRPLTRLAFRMAFIYFLLFAFCDGNGSIFQSYGPVGGWIDGKLTFPLFRAAEFLSLHVFHFTGIGATFHPTGSGDILAQWVLQVLFVALAVCGGVLWTLIAAARGNRRVEYQTLYAWLRFLLRLTTGMFMLNYGLAKLFPFQMPPVSIAVLNEPVGNMSPMTFLWSLIGMNPQYEIVCGVAEVLGGVLILFRRTALAGALLSAFVMANVLLYNLFFDVPVKLFAANLLLALLFITIPDVPALFRFFWLHQPAAPSGVWVPPVERRGFRIATRTVELIFVTTFLVWMPVSTAMAWRHSRADLRKANPLLGAWNIEAQQPPSSFDSPEHQPITALYVDSPVRAFSRSADGQLWRTWLDPDSKAQTLRIGVYVNDPVNFSVKLQDGDHATLTAIPPKADGKNQDAVKKFRPVTLTLTRIPVPSHYPLLDRGFHWVNEWGLER